MEVLYFMLSVLALVIWIVIANEFGNIAELKGYYKTKYAWYTFLFSFAGMLMVVALPNLNKENAQ